MLESTTEDGSKIELVIGFAADSTIQSIRRPTDDEIGTWYYDVSYHNAKLHSRFVDLTQISIQKSS